MIKGVNRQVVEITQTQCEYFEKVLFFIKPEYSAVSEGDLRERATIIAQSAGMPPAVRLRKNKLRAALNMSVAACIGAAVSAAVNAFNKELLANHIRSCVVRDIHEGRDEVVDELVSTIQKLMK